MNGHNIMGVSSQFDGELAMIETGATKFYMRQKHISLLVSNFHASLFLLAGMGVS
jgi:hypothetical protein